MNNLPLPKKPKMEPLTIEEEEEKQKSNPNKASDNNHRHNNTNNNSNMLIEEMRSEQEEALVALIEHRAKEVEHLRNRITYYKSQLDEAERRLEQTKLQLARHRGLDNANTSKSSQSNGTKEIKVERRSASPAQISERSSQNHPHMKEIKVERRSASPAQITEGSSQNHPQSKPRIDQGNEKFSRNYMGCEQRSAGPLQINEGSSENQSKSRPQLATPSVNPRTPQPIKSKEPEAKVPTVSGSRPSTPVPSHANSLAKAKVEKSQKELAVEVQPKGTKRKLEQKEHKELIPLIRSSSSPSTIRCQTGCLISSQHKRKLRSLILCPTNDQLFVTSALDGVVNLWQLQGKGSNANRLSSTECVSAKERRWPEDIAWHPEGNSLFSVYSADGGDSQLSILNLNKTKEKARVSYLEEKPHVKGIINNIIFMPWDDLCFVTGGSDHAVVLWTDKDGEDSWKPRALHRNLHSSAVMGVAGMQHKRTVLSVGADKRIIGYDLVAGRYEYKHQIESKCMSVLTNPCDFNLFMVQTGAPERQLRLFDIRLRQTEIHAFGWKQESSESQSALINQAWSPDGLYLTSGSADPVIHVFDIRYNARKPSQSVKAHQKRVFKAAWHYAFPLLISISSDLNIGLHKII